MESLEPIDEPWDQHLSDLSDLPCALIVTNVPAAVFKNESDKISFESLFSRVGEDVEFEYFRSFKRARVTFESPEQATVARLHCDRLSFMGETINCFFAQTSESPGAEEMDSSHLKPPPLEKQFLISPPASPPVGWEQCPEAHPVIDLELIARLAALSAGAAETQQEIHPGSTDTPAIVIHTCGSEDEDDASGDEIGRFKPRFKPPFIHTPCPQRHEL